ncbi:MAG: hypothetical protein P8Z79_12645, partial [Sedimentisphaerales bacterium]
FDFKDASGAYGLVSSQCKNRGDLSLLVMGQGAFDRVNVVIFTTYVWNEIQIAEKVRVSDPAKDV